MYVLKYKRKRKKNRYPVIEIKKRRWEDME